MPNTANEGCESSSNLAHRYRGSSECGRCAAKVKLCISMTLLSICLHRPLPGSAKEYYFRLV